MCNQSSYSNIYDTSFSSCSLHSFVICHLGKISRPRSLVKDLLFQTDLVALDAELTCHQQRIIPYIIILQRDGCPKIVNLGSSKTDLFYERKKYGFKKR